MTVYWSDDEQVRENPEPKPNRTTIRPKGYGDIPAPPGQEEEEKRLHPSAYCPCEICQSQWVGVDE